MPLKSIYRLVGGFLILAVGLIPAPERSGDEIENLLFEDFYHLLGFSPETNYQVMKWLHPIRYTILIQDDIPAEDIVASVHEVMLTFGELTGVKIKFTTDEDTANFKVRLQRPDFEDNLFRRPHSLALCYADIDDGRDYFDGIPAMEIVLPNNSYDQAVGCLEHELMHAFGFWQHVPIRPEYRSTLANYSRPNVEQVTKADLIWIWTLYSPELRPGMGPDEAKRAARRAIARVYGEFLALGNTLTE